MVAAGFDHDLEGMGYRAVWHPLAEPDRATEGREPAATVGTGDAVAVDVGVIEAVVGGGCSVRAANDGLALVKGAAVGTKDRRSVVG